LWSTGCEYHLIRDSGANEHSHGEAKLRYQALDKMVGELGGLSSRIVKDKVVRDTRGWMSSLEGFA